MPEFTTDPRSPAQLPAHAALATVFQVRDDELQVLLWERARDPFRGAWSLPGGALGSDETLEESILRHLAAKVDVREVAHLEQLGTWSAPDRHPGSWELATAYLGLVPLGIDPRVPEDTRWHPVDSLPSTAFDHGAIALAGRERLRGKLSYSNVGFALAPATFTLTELRDIYAAALGYDVSPTNLKRVLLRRGAIEPTGERRTHGPSGGRPAEVFRFHTPRLEVTDPFAVLRPPSA
jgi:ADP-ribose pyrophosphatase YjhB (NUDIX family)